MEFQSSVQALTLVNIPSAEQDQSVGSGNRDGSESPPRKDLHEPARSTVVLDTKIN